MLTNIEKEILGYMVDMGNLRGQQRIEASVNDEIARNLIADFTVQMQIVLPQQIQGMEIQRGNIETELIRLQSLQELIG